MIEAQIKRTINGKGPTRMVKNRYADPLDKHPIIYVTDLETLGSSHASLVIRPVGMKQNLHLSPHVILQIVSFAIQHYFVSIPQVLRIVARILSKGN